MMKLSVKQRQRAAVRSTWIWGTDQELRRGTPSIATYGVTTALPRIPPPWHQRQSFTDFSVPVPLAVPPAENQSSVNVPSIARFNHDARRATRLEGWTYGAAHNLLLDEPVAVPIPDGKGGIVAPYTPRVRPVLDWEQHGEPLLLEGQDVLPAGEISDAPLPLRRPPIHPAQPWIVVGEPVPLEGQDTVPGDQWDDPNPLVRPPWHPSQDWLNIILPDLQRDDLPDGRMWTDPNPLTTPSHHLRQDWLYSGEPLILEAQDDLVDGQQWDDPNPLRRPPVPEDWIWPSLNTLLLIPPIVTPEIATYGTALIDQYFPARRPQPQWTWQGEPLLLEGQDVLPAGDVESDPTPLRRPPVPEDWIWPTLNTLLLIPPPVLPEIGTYGIETLDRYTPRGQVQPSWIWSGEPLLLERQDVLPSGEIADAPNPLTRPDWHPSQAWRWAGEPLILEGQDALPDGDQAADPNPIRRPAHHLRQGWLAFILPDLDRDDLPDGRMWTDPNPLQRERIAPSHTVLPPNYTSFFPPPAAIAGKIWAEPLPIRVPVWHRRQGWIWVKRIIVTVAVGFGTLNAQDPALGRLNAQSPGLGTLRGQGVGQGTVEDSA